MSIEITLSNRSIPIFAGIFLSLIILGCSSSEELTPEEKVTQLLTNGSGTWTPSTTSNAITLGGIDVQEEFFSGFTIKFSQNKITTTGTTPVWLREDTWVFKPNTEGKVIIRGMDNKEIQIVDINSTQLKLILDWDKTTYGRTASLPGRYEFVLNK